MIYYGMDISLRMGFYLDGLNYIFLPFLFYI